MRTLSLVCAVVVLSSCALLPPRPAPTPGQIRALPTATWTPIPTLTSTPASPTVSPPPTPDPAFFRDDFRNFLGSGWTWVREDPENWSLIAVPDALQIHVTSGYVSAGNNQNMLLRPAPSGDFQIETQISFRPAQHFQFAGLIIYQDDENFIQGGRGYCDGPSCPGEGLYMDPYRNGLRTGPEFSQPYSTLNPILLRLSRTGDTFAFEASTDGKIWFVIGSHTSGLRPLRVGLVAGQGLRGDVLPAVFEYFEVRSLP